MAETTTSGEPALQPVESATKQTFTKPLLPAELTRRRLADIIPYHPTVVVVRTDETVFSALSRMAITNISAVPVVDGNNQVTAFLDVLDFLSYMMVLVGVEVPESGEAIQLTEEQLQNIKRKDEEFKNSRIQKVIRTINPRPYDVLSVDATLSDAVTQYLKGTHRIAVREDGNLVGVVSQFTILNYLASILPRLKHDSWLATFVGDFPNKTEKVLAIEQNTFVFDAWLQMRANNLASLAVVNEKGKLVGNLSASDLKPWMLLNKDLKYLLRPTVRFLARIRKYQGRSGDFVVTASPDDKMSRVLYLIHLHRVHRVYIVNQRHEPVSVIALSDIMKNLANWLQQHEQQLEKQRQQQAVEQQQPQQPQVEERPRVTPTF